MENRRLQQQMNNGRPIITVKNQFKFSRDTNTACMPISILAIYHLYNGRNRILGDDDWKLVMKNGARLWAVWRKNNTTDAYPAADEILQLKECTRFVSLFGDTPEEYCEWALSSKKGDIIARSLVKMFEDVERLVTKENKTVACLIVLPGFICLSVSCFRPNEYQFFDSHGNGKNDYCDFTIFTTYRAVLETIYDRYGIHNLEMNEFCSYSAMLFVKSNTTSIDEES